MKLYELVQEERTLNNLFLEAINEETGEIKDSETLELLEKELKISLENKSAGIIKMIRNQEADLQMIDTEMERLKFLRAKIAKNLDNFKEYVKYNMQNLEVKKIETSLGSISLRQSTSTDVFDEELIPKKYMTEKITYTPQKTEIKKAIEAGEKIEGARLILKTSLVIR